MLIKDLTLTNFRVFKGENRFNLMPEKSPGKSLPIILFGGLNGSGKTSILTGIRLALYGRFCLGKSVSQKRYDEFLRDSIHHSLLSSDKKQKASVEMTFTYAKLGEHTEYNIRREWELKKNSVKEVLVVLENGQPIKGLNHDQAQSFLYELIPIGVSDLFFFDGEKISELAEETDGSVLEQSIKKLLGLDVVERLSSDLVVLNRNLAKRSTITSIQKEIEKENQKLAHHRENIEVIQQELTILSAEKSEFETHSKQLNKSIQQKGGHFSSTRQDLELHLKDLYTRRDGLKTRLHALIGDVAPISLASGLVERVEEQIKKDLALQQDRYAIDALESSLYVTQQNLKNKLPPDVLEIIEEEFSITLASSRSSSSLTPVHDLTPAQAGRIHATFRKAENQKELTLGLFSDLEKIESELDEIGAALSRAPDDSIIKEDFDNLQIIQKKIGTLDQKAETLKMSARAEAIGALETARRLDRLFEKASEHSDKQRVLNYIENADALLREFVLQTASSKIDDLEEQFTECFARLSRKNDMQLEISIDPESFEILLKKNDGSSVGKAELSAGEKQIFAIAVLQALAKTSGRQLPMIVDTPLGRLDSSHRGNLIERYFPDASHQMIILSTDTEVDEKFYSELKPYIARSYKLEYDPNSGCSSAVSGYFWNWKEAV